ncbi:hypothetical protein HUJ04_004995 [Dendroctonus ponderosae]|nr:hypothetical protein HUJ04_004995 [Dendroctonus ponderosae]
MEAAEIQNVCRLCPSTELQNDDSLINVFDNNMEKNMMEVILVTTGIQFHKDKGTGVLINVFDNDLKEHLKDVVLVTTGIHVSLSIDMST